MALSEHERRVLDQIAQQLEQEDPKLASRMGPLPLQSRTRRHVVAGVFAGMVGCLVLLVGVAAQAMFLGVLGFLIMGAGAYLATMRIGALRIRSAQPESPPMGQIERG